MNPNPSSAGPMRFVTLALLLSAGMMGGGCSEKPPTGEVVPWDQLIRDLSDPSRVADLAAPGATIITSHDRSNGNEDYNHPLDTDANGWELLADLEGPGYISRFWMTGIPQDHRIQFFFDDERTPRIDTTVATLSGNTGTPPFLSPLCIEEQLCILIQVPIPFQQRVRILSAPRTIGANGWPRMFYQLESRGLSPGKTIDSFPREDLPDETLAAIRSVCEQWETQAFSPALAPAGALDHRLEIPPGSNREVRLAGGGIIRLLQARLQLPDDASALARERVLRDTRLQAFWDGTDQPSIDVPFGDFFGSPWHAAQFESMYFGQLEGTFFSRFPMPFASGARWVAVNEGTRPIVVEMGFEVAPAPAPGQDLGTFHAAWNRSSPQDVGSPHEVLETTGRGAYAGCLLTVASQVNSWWILESDESIRVDQAPAPQWQGTGLEDYFNGGWYYQFAHVRPTYGVLYKAPFRTIQFRTHPNDPVHFESGVQVQFERGPDNASPGWMESTAFYYLAEPQAAASDLPAPADRIAPESPARQQTLMTELTNLERLGDLSGASRAIDAYVERFPNTPQEMLRLRQLAYRERMEGVGAVQDFYHRAAARTEHPASAKAAQDLLWFHQHPSHALLSVYCRNKTTVYLDGLPIVQTLAPQQIFTFPVTLEPGPHVLALEAEQAGYPEWVLAHLRTHQGPIATHPDWRFAYAPAGNWKKPGYDDSGWAPMGGNGAKGPPEVPVVYVEPTAHVLNVSEARGLRPRGPTSRPQGTFVFRREFEIPEPSD